MESIDKAIYRTVSESSGRNESERIGDLENLRPRGPESFPSPASISLITDILHALLRSSLMAEFPH
jgi:hypothetical protein